VTFCLESALGGIFESVCASAEGLLSGKVQKYATMVRSCCVVEWLIAYGLNGVRDDRAYECVINPYFATEIRVGFGDIGMTAFPYINQIALVGDTVDGAVGGVNVLIKIAEKNQSNAPCLLKLV
jgi:hypothetical protein